LREKEIQDELGERKIKEEKLKEKEINDMILRNQRNLEFSL